MAWEKVKLGDIAICIQPGPFGSQLHNSDYSESGTPIIMPKDMIDGKISHSNLIFVGEEHTKRLCRHQVHAGNLMVARKGDVRKCVFITENENGWMTGSDCLKVALKENYCYPRFIYYQLRSPFIGRWLEKISIGATMPSINTGLLSSIELVLPSLKEQKRIADILSAYDDLIENNQKQIKLLEEAAQRLYKQWFIDLRYPGHETTPIVDGLPEGWRKDTVDSIVSLLSGFAFKSDSFSENGVFKIVTIKNVQDGTFDGENVSLIDEIPAKMPEHCILNSGDILLSLTGNVGRVCMVVGEKYLLNQRVAKLKSDYPSFTYCLFRSKDMFDEMNNLANGAAQQNLSPIRTGQIKITVPSVDMLKMFENRIGPLISRMLILWEQNKSLTQSRDRLLPKLMNGELEV